MEKTHDPMGTAIADYWKNGVAGRLRVFAPDFDEDEIPVETLFREWDEMPVIEQTALREARGRILDVGAGAGCHSLALQEMGHEVRAIDLSPLSVATMRNRGVKEAATVDFWQEEERYDTILMLMNGIGIVGRLERLPAFFHHIDRLLTEGGQVLLDSSDLRYLYETEDGSLELPVTEGYYGEMTYHMQYKRVRGEAFPWLYLDFDTLAHSALAAGFVAEKLVDGEHYDYLARLVRRPL